MEEFFTKHKTTIILIAVAIVADLALLGGDGILKNTILEETPNEILLEAQPEPQPLDTVRIMRREIASVPESDVEEFNNTHTRPPTSAFSPDENPIDAVVDAGISPKVMFWYYELKSLLYIAIPTLLAGAGHWFDKKRRNKD